MATPRSPYVCIADSLLDEPWPPEIKLALVMLSCHIHVRWRASRRMTLESACTDHPVGVEDAMKITGKGRSDIAWKSLRRLADFASISVRLPSKVGGDVEGNYALISWPKWSEYNNSVSRQPGSKRSPVSPSESESESESESNTKNRRTPRKRVARSAGKTDPPEQLSEEQRSKLRAWATSKEPWAVPSLEAFEETCLDHFRAEGKRKADWLATVRRWITNDRKWALDQGRPHASQEYEREQRRQAAHAAYLEREKQREEAEASAEYPELADIFDNSDLGVPH